MKKILLFIFCMFGLFLFGCGKNGIIGEKGEWMGFYYPDKYDIGNSSLWVIEGGFDSLDECRKWANTRGRNSGDDFDYECGYNCKPSGGLYFCEQTLD